MDQILNQLSQDELSLGYSGVLPKIHEIIFLERDFTHFHYDATYLIPSKYDDPTTETSRHYSFFSGENACGHDHLQNNLDRNLKLGSILGLTITKFGISDGHIRPLSSQDIPTLAGNYFIIYHFHTETSKPWCIDISLRGEIVLLSRAVANHFSTVNSMIRLDIIRYLKQRLVRKLTTNKIGRKKHDNTNNIFHERVLSV